MSVDESQCYWAIELEQEIKQEKLLRHLHWKQFGLVSRVDAVTGGQTSIRSNDRIAFTGYADNSAVSKEEAIQLG